MQYFSKYIPCHKHIQNFTKYCFKLHLSWVWEEQTGSLFFRKHSYKTQGHHIANFLRTHIQKHTTIDYRPYLRYTELRK